MRLLSLALAGAWLTAAPLAQVDLTLLVRAGDTRVPLGGAVLEVGGVRGATGPFGEAELSGVPPGPLAVRVEAPGYVALDTTIVVEAGGDNVAVLPLRSDARVLGDVVVEAETINDAVLRRRGFFERRENRAGVFITREELDRRGATLFSDVFRSIPGVRVRRDGSRTSLVSSRRQNCDMSIYFDGVEMAYAAQNIEGLPFDDIIAVEVYRGPSELPIEYTQTRSSLTCGAVIVWTRMNAGE